MRRAGTILIVALGLALGCCTGATGAVGDLTYEGCLSGDGGLGALGICATTPNPTVIGANSGLDDVESVAASPDGRSVYAVTQFDHSVVAFARDPATGELSFVNCVTGELTAVGNCDEAPGATLTGDNSGMNQIESVSVSPDGASVYATSRFDDAIIHLVRDPTTGKLAFGGCISGEDASTPPCTALPSQTADGQQSGFDDPKLKAPVLTADGRFVFVVGAADASVLRFARDPTTGVLTYLGCLTGETATVGACSALPSTGPGGLGSGLAQPRWLTIGPEGRTLYAVATGDTAIARFSLDPSNGAFSFLDCVTGDSSLGACSPIPSATAAGVDSGFRDARALAISPDGASLYLATGNDHAISTFARDRETGALTYRDCLTTDTAVAPGTGTGACTALGTPLADGANTGLDGMRSMLISADGRSLYVASQFDHAVAEFDRDLVSGDLAFSGCITGKTTVSPCAAIPTASATGVDTGLQEVETLALSDDHHLYGGVEFDAGVARFAREPDLDPPETRLTKKPKKRTKKRRARFAFEAGEPLATFECRLDKQTFKPCESPLRTKKLKRRRHTFRVRAIDTAGNADPTPAKAKFKVKKRKRR